jgi:2-polyprenyl-3-methyl-5-hydroxy-6-metoxy-1,4-benzoquinol methylase
MIKEIIKDQIRKTGMVRELEMKNEDLISQIKELKNKIEVLQVQLISKESEIQKIKLERSEMVGFSLNRELRGLSPDAGKPAILKYILDNIPKDARILDVGFGSGVYGKLLRALYYQNIDAIDVYDKNIEEMGLDKIYDNIFIENILDFDFDYYDLIIMGDVLEHIELESAKKLLLRFIEDKRCNSLIVSIPYEYEQDELYGNNHEKHLQPEVTAEYMEEHYPYLKIIESSIMANSKNILAVYVWNRD